MASNLGRMCATWDDAAMDCLMLMAPTFNSIGFDGKGDFTMDATGKLKRREAQRIAPFAWPGVQMIHPRLVARGPDGVFSTNKLWDIAIGEGRLFGIRLDGKWMHVGTPESRDEADAFMATRHLAP
jgi:MurNAc alpha-1-phosphate uridylyltransferase